MQCPVCKADNSQGPACRRCKADLSLLWEIEERREALLASARRHLACGGQSFGAREIRECRHAAAAAAAAARLRAGPDAEELTALARLLGRDFAGAYRTYLAFKGVPGNDPRPEEASRLNSPP